MGSTAASNRTAASPAAAAGTPAAPAPIVPLRLILGLLVFMAGGLLLADSLDLLRAESGWVMWPLAVIVLGLVVRLQAGTGAHTAGIVLMVAGVWLLLNELDIWTYSLWSAWPFWFVVLGAWMLYRVDQMRRRAGGAAQFDEPTTVSSDAGALAFIAEVRRATAGQSLRSVQLTALLGGCNFDARNARPGARPVVVDTFALAGCIRIAVPPGWVVEQRVLPFAARVDDDRASVPAGVPDLVVRGAALLGVVEIVDTP